MVSFCAPCSAVQLVRGQLTLIPEPARSSLCRRLNMMSVASFRSTYGADIYQLEDLVVKLTQGLTSAPEDDLSTVDADILLNLYATALKQTAGTQQPRAQTPSTQHDSSVPTDGAYSLLSC